MRGWEFFGLNASSRRISTSPALQLPKQQPHTPHRRKFLAHPSPTHIAPYEVFLIPKPTSRSVCDRDSADGLSSSSTSNKNHGIPSYTSKTSSRRILRDSCSFQIQPWSSRPPTALPSRRAPSSRYESKRWQPEPPIARDPSSQSSTTRPASRKHHKRSPQTRRQLSRD